MAFANILTAKQNTEKLKLCENGISTGCDGMMLILFLSMYNYSASDSVAFNMVDLKFELRFVVS